VSASTWAQQERDLEDQANGLQLLAAAASEEHDGMPDVNTDATANQDKESENDSDDEDWDSGDEDDDGNDNNDDKSSIDEPKH
jgi:hypothetical protein